MSKDRPWRDSKRYLWPLSLVAPAGPFFAWLLAHHVSGLLWGFGAYLVLVAVPLIDVVCGPDRSSPPDGAVRALAADRYYRWCTYLFVPVQYAGFVFGAWCLANEPMTTGERGGLAITMGISAAVGINAAHELGHKNTRSEKSFAKLALAPSFYGHFFVEHNVGHHVRVATPADPASARLGESLWVFYPRALVGGFLSGVRSQAGRLRRQGHGFWHPSNDILQSWTISVVLFAAVIGAFGWEVAPWLALQAVIGMLVLEAVNYIEHYGLLRAREPDGRLGRVRPEHSWNGDHPGSNVLLLNLQRHSDHHAHGSRRYQALRSCKEAPQLPAGYALMVLTALVTPLWRVLMDPRVVAHYDGDVTRANLQPSKAAKLIHRYSPGVHRDGTVHHPALRPDGPDENLTRGKAERRLDSADSA
ncbi:alkane 1-monooxygenase [Tomitella cavernea]|nr:alkane 1-monooxygenase [Tomitella cavernea]